MEELQPSGPTAGLFSVAAALEAGWSQEDLRVGETFAAPFRGVRAPRGVDLDLAARCHALQTVLDGGVAFSHVTALRLLGVDLPWTVVDDDAIHVVTPSAVDRPQREGVAAHRSRQRFLETIVLDGLLVTSPAQTFVHVAVGQRRPDDVVILGDAMMRRTRPLTTTAALTGIAERTRKVKGIVQVREQIHRMRPGTDSVMETRTRLLLTAANLPCPMVNEIVWAPHGEYVKRVDLLYPRHRIAIEYDGDQHRTDQAQWRDDVWRRRWLEELGWTVIVAVADDVIRDPSRLIARVRAAIAAAEQR